MDIIIEWLLENVFFWTAVLGFCLGFILKNSKYSKCENALRLMFFWYVGLSFTYSGIMHILLGPMVAASIGWTQSPFQFEVGLANLSVAALGFMACFKPERYFQLGAMIALSIFSIGAGVGHVYQLLTQHDHAIDNAGTTLYIDIIAPLVMLVLWWKIKK